MPLILVLIAAAIVAKFAWLIAAVLVTVAVSCSVGKWLARRDDRWLARRRREAMVCARADRQHAAVLAGDQSGLYGEFPPAV